ncbi:MAG: hypothetical protein ABL977_00510 [Candidatus Eisenbacteria bacterium]
MREVLRSTWFATLMFAVAIVGAGVALGWIDPRGAWLSVALVIPVTVPTWWWVVGRRDGAGPGRGALAGALCAALVFLVPIAFLIFTIVVRGFGEGDGVVGVMTLAGMFVVAIPLGAAVGAIVLLLQRRWFV